MAKDFDLQTSLHSFGELDAVVLVTFDPSPVIDDKKSKHKAFVIIESALILKQYIDSIFFRANFTVTLSLINNQHLRASEAKSYTK